METLQNLEFGYWNIIGRGDMIRMLLHYLKITYTEKNPDFTNYEDQVKSFLESGHSFPNLPYILTKDGFYLSETKVINNFLCQKSGRKDLICYENPQNNARISEIYDVLFDTFLEIYKFLYEPDVEKAKNGILEAIKKGGKFDKKISSLSNFLGEKNWAVGDHFTLADLYLAHQFFMFETIVGSAGGKDYVTGFENLRKLKERVFGLEGIKEFLEDEGERRDVLFPSMCSWLEKEE